jgi:hypothetical protein
MIALAAGPKISSKIVSTQSPFNSNEFVLVLQPADSFINDGIFVGTVKAGDNGFSTRCSYNDVILELKKIARAAGANVLKITSYKKPNGMASTCARIQAEIYRVAKPKDHEVAIAWDLGRPLQWEDFKETPPSGSDASAGTYDSISFDMYTLTIYVYSKQTVTVYNNFRCDKSWVKPESKNNIDLLVHEQGYFDLGEVYARTLRRDFSNYSGGNISQKEALRMYNEVMERYKTRITLYNHETKQGTDEKAQYDWNQRISWELKDLKDYTQPW